MRRALLLVLVGLVAPAGASGMPRSAKKVQHARTSKVSVSRTPARAPAVHRAAARSSSSTADSFFLGGDPHTPLAVVHQGTLRSAVAADSRANGCGKRSRWATVGTTWRALDAWGQSAGTATVQLVDDSEPSRCAYLVFGPKFTQGSGRYVFVSTDSGFQPAASVQWQVPTGPRRAFEKLLDDTLRAERQDRQSEHCSVLGARSRYFQYDNQKLAVGGGEGGYVIAAYGKSWSVQSGAIRPASAKGASSCYRPVSVFDLDGDGVPEVVMRYFEADTFGDVVLARDETTGKWNVVASGPAGSSV